MNIEIKKTVFEYNGRVIELKTTAFDTLKRLEKIAVWLHRRKFPKVSSEEQLQKVIEESDELFNASAAYDEVENEETKRNYYFEYADNFLALNGLKRFDKELAIEGLYDLGFNYGIEVGKGVPLMLEKLMMVYFDRQYIGNRHVG